MSPFSIHNTLKHHEWRELGVLLPTPLMRLVRTLSDPNQYLGTLILGLKSDPRAPLHPALILGLKQSGPTNIPCKLSSGVERAQHRTGHFPKQLTIRVEQVDDHPQKAHICPQPSSPGLTKPKS